MKRKQFGVVPLGKLLEEAPRNGYSPVSPALPTGKWVLSLSALDGRGLDLSEPKPAPANDPLVDKFFLRPGDFLISRSNTFDKVGRVGVFRGGVENCAYPDLMMKFRPDRMKVNPLYLETYLRSDAALKFIRQHATGTSGSMKKINQATVESIPIALPSMDEQLRTAELLLVWFIAVQKFERLIALKERHFKAVAHQLLTSRKRLKGRSALWRFRRADEIFESISHKGHSGEPLLSVTQEWGVIPRSALENRVTMPSGNRDAFKLVEPGSFVISLRSFQGGIEHSSYRGLVSPAYTVLRAADKIDEGFFRHYFKSVDFIKRLSVAVVGIRDGKQISFQDFCSIKLPFPLLDEQKAIASVLDEAEREINFLKQSLSAIKRQKRGLMQNLLTGRWQAPLPEQEIR